MIILFECRSIVPNHSGGIENYTYMLVKAWKKYYPNDIFILNIPPKTIHSYKEKLGNGIQFVTDPIWQKKKELTDRSILYKVIFKISQILFPFLRGYLNGYRKKWAEELDNLVDVVVCTYHKAKIVHNPSKLILVVHDFRTWDFEQKSISRQRKIYEQTKIIRNSSKIVISWPYPFKRMLQLFPEKKTQTTMIPFLIEPFKKSIIEKKKGNYLYYSSNNGLHKNHENLIKGLAIYNKRNLDCQLELICTGPAVPDRTIVLDKLIKSEGMEHKIKFLGFVDREEVNELYRNAFAIITATKYEAFSGTILEAFGHKKPVLGSSIPANIEFLKYYNLDILLFDPDSPKEIALSIEIVRDSYEKHEKKSVVGFNKLKSITQEYTVSKFKEIANELIKKN